jgi:lipopolysaccharide/colanic/teichoic acid biosynthesis glycosyltransferase
VNGVPDADAVVGAAFAALDRTATFYARHGKRVLDLALALPGTVAISPILGGLALIVRTTSGSPVFFRQERVGKDGRVFRIFKFRTMVVGAVDQGAGIYLEENDTRITWAGDWLRATSLDELPQVFNVLRGEMSLVGPRPNLPEIVARYGRRYDRILKVKPGMTCLVAIRGRNQLRRSQMFAYDEEYVETMSLRQDLRIILETLPAVLFRRGSTNDVSEEFLEDVEPELTLVPPPEPR